MSLLPNEHKKVFLARAREAVVALI
jgi:hypothetical protein